MTQTRHCDLCEHPKRDLRNGLTCGLTNKEPDFEKTCTDILLDEKFQSKIEYVNLELHKVLKSRKKVYLKFFILMIVGFLMIIGNKLYAEMTHNDIYYWKFRAGAIGFGVVILISAFFKLNRFRTRLKAVEFDKNKIDTTLKEYQINYNVSFNYKDEVHGNQNIEINTEYKNWTRKRTKKTLTIVTN